jgi:tetratricopeptide (TPR) repeat protein
MPTMRFATLLLLLVAPVLVVSCGGGSSDPTELTDEGYRALDTGDFSAAQASFEKALDVIGDDTAHAQYLDASLGAIEARTKSDPQGAREALVALCEAQPGKVTDKEFSRVASTLGTIGGKDHLKQAIELVGYALQLYPDAESLKKQVTALGDKAKASGDEGNLDLIKGLGYGG